MVDTSFEQQFEQLQIQNNMDRITYKIMVMSNKGGVGKSTFAANIAEELAFRNQKVGLLDIDIHGPSQAKIFNLNNQKLTTDEKGQIFPFTARKNLKVVTIAGLLEDETQPIIWRGPLKINLIKQFLMNVSWGDLDYLIIDAPPGTGDEPLTIVQLIANLDGIVLVTTPQDLALLDSKKAVFFAEKTKIPILGILENMAYLYCPDCHKKINLFQSGNMKDFLRKKGIDILGSFPFDPRLAECMDGKASFIDVYKETEVYAVLKNMVDKIEALVRKNTQKK
jgi:Mrp family chromosome partitioning ATPase